MTTTLAHVVNPHAGLHAVTADAYEVQAARRAAEASLREFPYYVERYGERGRMFGASDGAWLVTLCAGDRDYARRQVLWLGSVLSARGMPRLLLERHLELLHGELLRLTRDGDRCLPLLDAALLLREMRHDHVPEREFAAAAAGFAHGGDAEWARRLPRMGDILVAAVADRAAGISNAVDAVTAWATDPSRFPPAWIADVQRTLADARTRLREPLHGTTR